MRPAMQRRAAHIDDFSPSDKGDRTTPTPVELYGEMADWLTPIRLDGRSVTELDLPCSVYAYKLKIGGEWTLDPENPRTRASGGHRNNVLSVGGAPEPLLFAPAPPFVHEVDGGGLLVTAALRRPCGDRLFVCFREGDAPERRTRMALAATEDEHLLFRARLPISSSSARLRFERDGGDDGALEGVFTYERGSAPDVPSFFRDALVYTVFVDRFRPAQDRPSWSRHPGREPAGGHLDGVLHALDELCDLGVTILYLTPIHIAASCHRYDIVDPLRVDPALGGEPALQRLLDGAHARGLRVLLDFSFSHVGRGFPAYEDVLARGAASPHADWFQWIDDDPAKSVGARRLKHYGTRDDAPLLNLANDAVEELVMRTVERWARAGVDGFRLDSAAEVPIELACRIRRRLKELRPESMVLAELVPTHAWRWISAGAIDAATDFGFHTAAVDWIARRAIDAAEARRRLTAIELARGAPPATALRFLSTHDHPRFATLARLSGGPGRTKLGLVLLFTSPGVPALLYGEEVGLSAESPALEPEDVWPDRAPMPWFGEARDEETRALVRRLAELRRASPALRQGDLEMVHAEGAVLVYRRAGGGEVIDIAVNPGEEALELDLEDEALPGLVPLVIVGDGSVEGQTLRLRPGAAIVARRVLGEGAARRRALEIAGNPLVRDADFAQGAMMTRAHPSRIDISLTERCNLRCQHCITFAPQRTQDGTARSLSPFLLDRLRGAMAFADYYGFVHGGEPLTAPLFFDVLAAIRSARAGRPYVVHLLTNGVLLTERTTAQLIEAQVSSISVSLDGATAETNDAVRQGGRFEAIVRNLRAAVRLRQELGADLRLGISTVVLKSNLAELDAIVDLAASAGVDWIKLEEAVPVNDYAARSLVRVGEAAARDAVQRAAARARSLGLVAVDHTSSPVVWRCKLAEQPEVASFLEADEFANRSEIHPCRGPWEHACVEPNGDVRLGDFFGPVLGNLAEEPIEALWSGAAARGERIRALATRLCGVGPVTCLPPRG